MLQLVSKNLLDTTQRVLHDLQNQIDDEATFAEKAAKAQSLWGSKGNSREKKVVFNEITNTLIEMCVYVDVCNYCEHNESNDIEHIDPKGFFPNKTFVWENYLRACKQCNSGYKLDTCFVLDNNDDIIKIRRGVEPTLSTIAFINPRVEDPNIFMILNLYTCKFDLMPDISKRDLNKAIKTIEILQLNNRDLLLKARQNAAIYYYQRMKLLCELLNSNSLTEIENILTPYDNDLIDKNLPLNQIKDNLKISFKKHISTYQHPSIWYSIKTVANKTNAKWQAIFNQIPEALFW